VSELEIDPFIAKVARELKEPVAFDAQFDMRVMAALEPEVISLDSRRVKQPWYRRQLAVPAPIAGLAAAAAFAGIAAVGILARQPSALQVAAAPQGAIVPVNGTAEGAPVATAPVQFVYLATQARSVAVIGDFNDWQPAAMTFDSAAQAWRVALVLPVGVHEYQFLVDGKLHVVDPTAPTTASDFGSPNSIVKVTPVP
jgi:hypothetical protein